jgi:hypothetical protein
MLLAVLQIQFAEMDKKSDQSNVSLTLIVEPVVVGLIVRVVHDEKILPAEMERLIQEKNVIMVLVMD